MRWPWQRDNPSSRAKHEAESFEAEDSNVIEVIPGELLLHVARHSFEASSGSIRCWFMVSSGLQRVDHKEIVLAAVLSDDDLPRGVGQVISLLCSIRFAP